MGVVKVIMVARGDVFRLSPTDKTCLSKDRSFSDFQGPNGTVRYRLVGFILLYGNEQEL